MVELSLWLVLKAAVAIFLIDIFWLITGGIYSRNMVERIQGKPIRIRYLSAVLVYILLGYSLLHTTSPTEAFLYGVTAYGTYDFTNYAIFEDYDWKFAIADTLWGGTLFTLAHKLHNMHWF